MNERIRELLEQAGVKYVTMPKDTVYEKLAELIVKECVRVMYDNAIERKVPPDINQTPTYYALAVLEHFGVQE